MLHRTCLATTGWRSILTAQHPDARPMTGRNFIGAAAIVAVSPDQGLGHLAHRKRPQFIFFGAAQQAGGSRHPRMD